ncbi:hypothetical protein Bpfe_010859, partial [Biomphalaria pfeifferi]
LWMSSSQRRAKLDVNKHDKRRGFGVKNTEFDLIESVAHRRQVKGTGQSKDNIIMGHGKDRES